MYETADRNPDFVCHAVDLTKRPHIVMQNDRVVAINSTTQMDLQGHAASESAGHRHISGTGGQAQFVRGAYPPRAARRSSACRPPMSDAAYAHPDFREDLEHDARAHGLIPRGAF